MSADGGESTPVRLPPEQFLRVVELTPLVSIDLVVRDGHGRMLLGARENRPAQGAWFVPGGRIGKNERIEAAFKRICEAELGYAPPFASARFLGVFEHLYDDNFAGAAGFGTHYIVLAYTFAGAPEALDLPRDQHSAYDWLRDEDVLARPDVHPHCRAYCGR